MIFKKANDLSVASTETRYIKLKTKTLDNIVTLISLISVEVGINVEGVQKLSNH